LLLRRALMLFRFACGSLLRLSLLLLFLLLRRALLHLVLMLSLSLLLFGVPFEFVPRTARVVVFRLQRRARVVCRRRPLHYRIVRCTTRRARGLLCHGLVLPRAACEVFVLFRQRARAGCRRGLL
jgi:hypothetical protein